MDAQMTEVMERLNSYYIESRYTEDIQELAATLTEAKAGVDSELCEVFAWISSKL